MTISSAINKVQIASGTSITITNLEIQSTDQLLITKKDALGVESVLVLTTDYTVNATLDTVTLLVALATDETATASLSIPNTQNTDYRDNSAFGAETVEAALDKMTLKNKQQQEDIDRSVKFPVSETAGSNIEILDPVITDADKYWKWNDDITGVEYFDLAAGTGIGNVADDTSPQLGGDLETNGNNIQIQEDDLIIFEGATDNAFETTLDVVDPTADNIVKLPDATDTLVGKATTDTLTNKTIDADNNTISNIALGAECTGASTDLTDTTAITYNADSDVSANTWVLDEDDMSSDSATKVPTQQSVKAFVDRNSGFSVYLSADQTTSHNTVTLVAFDTEEYDIGSEFDSTTNYRFTPTIAGKYLFCLNLEYNDLDDTKSAQVYIRKNGSNTKAKFKIHSPGANLDPSISLSVIIDMNGSTDYVDVTSTQFNGTDLDIQSGSTIFSGQLILKS